ncbi:MAG: 50S ribosomal protein L25 [Candidatus Falkowbacteria bacterium]
MSKEIKLSAKSRDIKKEDSRKTRTEGFIPAVIYGHGTENQNIKVKKNDFEKTFDLAGESNLIDLSIDENPSIKIIVKDVQREGVRGTLLHADFYQVDMSQKITTEIPLNFIGDSKAIRELGGMLVKGMDSIEVECLPGDLVDHIDIDLSKIDSFDDVIKISDLNVPKSMSLLGNVDDLIASVAEHREEIVKETSVEEDKKEVEGEKVAEDKTSTDDKTSEKK